MRLFYRAFLVVLGLAASGALAFERFVVLENLNLPLGAFDLRIPRLAMEDTPLTKEALAAILASNATPRLAERLARFSAGRARIPEAQAESLAGDRKKALIFNDLLLDAVVAGRVGALRVGFLEERLRENNPPAVARYENLSVSGLDLPSLARLFAGESAPAGAQALADAAALENFAVSAGKGGVSLTAARLSTRRPRLSALPEKGESRSEGEVVNDMLQAIAFETLEAHDVALTGRETPADATYAIGARDFAFEGLDKGVARKARLSGFSSKSADGGRIGVEALAFEGLDLGAALTRPGLRALHFDRARIERLAGDAPAPDGRGRVKFALASGALDLGNFRDGAPTKALARFQGFSVDLAARGEDPSAAFLRGLGYSSLELAGAADAQWLDSRRELEVAKLSLESRDMFALSLRLKLSRVEGGVFSAGPLIAASMLMAARFDRVEATLSNAKLLDRLIEQSARESGVDPAKLRLDYARDMGRAILGALGESDKAKRIAAAVERFVLNRRRLRIALTAPQGLGVTDLIRSPPDILQQLEVDAVGE
jgi:hypothetical protein